jgi:tetratricopeptide (TPR) repeat protein
MAVAALATLLASTGAAAQSTPATDALKRELPAATPQPLCPPVSVVKPPSDGERRQARDLAMRGKQAAVLGDRTSARDQLARAAALDPTDADLAYQHARALEAAGSGADAAKAYCRFLALAPTAPEAADVRERVAAFAPPPRSIVSDGALARFRAGLAAYDTRDMRTAETAFDSVTTLEPNWADAYYDLALTRVAQRQLTDAATDFEQYLRLKPEADDRAAVVARLEALRRATLSPGRALSLGLLVPGGGQFYTGRPTRGLLTLGAFSLGIGCAMQQRTTQTMVTQTATDPFGNPYTFQSARYTTNHPCLVPGLLAAAAVAITSAYDAYRYAGNQ